MPDSDPGSRPSVVPQGTQVFVYDEGGRLLGEYDNYGRARNEHVWLADRPVALIVYTYSGTSTTPLTTTVYSVEADHLGTPRLITDSAQAQRWSWHSAPYGDTQPNQNPAGKGTLVYSLRFPGQYYDKETNLHYNWHRDYESTTGRYIQSDPIGLAGGINTYAYVNGNPLLWIDPTGEVPIAPIVYGYAKCMAQCMAFDAASEWLTGGSVQCLDAGELAKSCALDCLNPMNWLGGNRLKAWKGPADFNKPPWWKDYPSKRGRDERHHIDPKYVGGDPKGPTVTIDAEYHQNITNRYRDLYPYGSGRLSSEERTRLMNEVYRDLPIPGF